MKYIAWAIFLTGCVVLLFLAGLVIYLFIINSDWKALVIFATVFLFIWSAFYVTSRTNIKKNGQNTGVNKN